MKDYKEISITEICKEAKVSRTAFYKNYKTKEDVIKDIIIDLNNVFVNEVGSPFTKLDKEYYKFFLSKVFEYKDVILFMNNTGFKDGYLQITNKIILGKESNKNVSKLQKLIWNGGIQNIINYVLSNGLEYDIDEIATTLANTIRIEG